MSHTPLSYDPTDLLDVLEHDFDEFFEFLTAGQSEKSVCPSPAHEGSSDSLAAPAEAVQGVCTPSGLNFDSGNGSEPSFFSLACPFFWSDAGQRLNGFVVRLVEVAHCCLVAHAFCSAHAVRSLGGAYVYRASSWARLIAVCVSASVERVLRVTVESGTESHHQHYFLHSASPFIARAGVA